MKSCSRYVSGIFIFLCCIQQVNGQTHLIDSLENDLKKSTNDSVGIFLVMQLTNKLFLYDSAKSLHYLEQGYAMAKRINWDYAWGYYYEHKAMNKQMGTLEMVAEKTFDTAIGYYQQSANAKRNKKETSDAILSVANCKGEKGELLLARQLYTEAIAEYILAAEAWEHSGNEQTAQAVGAYYGKISTVYYKLNQIDKALIYDQRSLALLQYSNNEEDKAFILIYVCDDFIRLHQLDSALYYLAKAKPIVEKLNNGRLNIQYYNKLGAISRQKKNYPEAIAYYNKTLAIAKRDNEYYQIVASLKIIGVCYKESKDYVTARKYLVPAWQGAKERNFQIEKTEILKELVDVEKYTNHKAEAFDYLEELDKLKDSSNIAASKKAIAEIENKYQAAKKEETIIQLQKDKQIQDLSIRQKSTLNYFLIGSLAAVFIIAGLIYLNFRNRHLLSKKEVELQQQKITELEKNRQLVAVDSMLKGQEDERSRLAKDLHDGLGGLLSGVKFSLSNMKDNLVITPDNMAVFERSLDMLDTSIKELRRVAHNMMPEMLTKFGLNEALKEYCASINATNLLAVKYQSLGMDIRLDSSIEIMVFRIVQELLNNIMKHAGATEAFVQLIKDDHRLNVVVEDNGKGFDVSSMEGGSGAGWINIRSRVDYLKGQSDIHSEPGKGTLVNIEFNV